MKKLAAVLVIALVASLSNAAMLEYEFVPNTLTVTDGMSVDHDINTWDLVVHNNFTDQNLQGLEFKIDIDAADGSFENSGAVFTTTDANVTAFNYNAGDVASVTGIVNAQLLQGTFSMKPGFIGVAANSSKVIARIVPEWDLVFDPSGPPFFNMQYDEIDPNDIVMSAETDVNNPLGSVVPVGGGEASDLIPVTQVPEPATMALLGLGGVAALIRRRK
jgi:hypothetical protein